MHSLVIGVAPALRTCFTAWLQALKRFKSTGWRKRVDYWLFKWRVGLFCQGIVYHLIHKSGKEFVHPYHQLALGR